MAKAKRPEDPVSIRPMKRQVRQGVFDQAPAAPVPHEGVEETPLEIPELKSAEVAEVRETDPAKAKKTSGRGKTKRPKNELKTDNERFNAFLRCRVTPEERDYWNRTIHDLTGQPQQFSRIFRALLVILDHSKEQLTEVWPKERSGIGPSKLSSVAMALDEFGVAKLIWEAIDKAGPPREIGNQAERQVGNE